MVEKLRGVQVLIVDAAHRVPNRIFNLLQRAACQAGGLDNVPFGGIACVFFADIHAPRPYYLERRLIELPWFKSCVNLVLHQQWGVDPDFHEFQRNLSGGKITERHVAQLIREATDHVAPDALVVALPLVRDEYNTQRLSEIQHPLIALPVCFVIHVQLW